MDKQTIQELEIIIKAQCESARKDLKKIAKDTQDVAKDISKSMDSINKNSTLDNVKKEFKKGQEEIQNFKEELRKIKISDNGINFEVKADMSDFDEQYQKALNEYNSKLVEIPVEYKQETVSKTEPVTNATIADGNNSQAIAPINKLKEAIKEAREEIKSLRNEAINLEFKGLNPYEILSFRDSLKLLLDQATTTIPILSEVRQSIEQNLNGDFGDSLLQKGGLSIINLKEKFNELANSVSEKMSNIKNSVSNAFNGITEPIKNKLSSITNLFGEIKNVGIGTFNKIKNGIQTMGDTAGTPVNKLKQIIDKLKLIKESDKTSSSGKSFGSNFGKSLEVGIKSIKKFSMSLLSVRTAFTAVSKAANAYLSFDTQLNDSIQNSWNVLGSLLGPALEYIAGLFSKLVNSVASFVKALTGIDLVAKANAKALDKQAKSASSASKSLSRIDDIDTLSTSSGGGDNQTITANIDESPFNSFIAKFKDLFSKIFEPFKLAWENVGAGVFDSAKEMLSSLGELASSVGNSLLEVWTNGTGQEIIENMLLGWQQIFDIIRELADAFTNAWNNAGTGKSIIQSIADIFKNIQKFNLDIGDSLKKWFVSESFQEALNKVFNFIDDIFKYAKDIAEWCLSMYEKYLKPVIDEKLLPAIDSIVSAIMDIWKAVKPVVDWTIDCIKTMLEPVIDGLCEFIGGIIDVVKGIADFISGVFTGDWKKAWDGVKTIFKGIWDMIASIVKTPINLILAGVEKMVNAIINGFNGFKKAINKISFDVPDWIPTIGGKKWGFNLKMSDEITLPRLAKGNVAYEPTKAIFGEYANAHTNPEITSPVSLMKESFRDVLNEFDFGGTRIDTLKIDVAGENFYQGAVDYINDETTRKGVSILKEV